jgi:hypothetical protein
MTRTTRPTAQGGCGRLCFGASVAPSARGRGSPRAARDWRSSAAAAPRARRVLHYFEGGWRSDDHREANVPYLISTTVFPGHQRSVCRGLVRGSALVRRDYACVLGTQTLGKVHEDEYVRIFLDPQPRRDHLRVRHANMESDRSRYSPLRDQDIPIVHIHGYMHRDRRAAAGSVRPTRAFFADLDRQLSSERGSEGRGVSGATFNG